MFYYVMMVDSVWNKKCVDMEFHLITERI